MPGPLLLTRANALLGPEYPGGWAPAAPLAELPDGKIVPLDVCGHPIVLVRLGEEVFALDGRCPHRGGPMEDGWLTADVISCPWHGFEFDVRTGAVVWPEGWDALDAYQTRIREGMVDVAVTYQ
jgi:nitrite reductase/ring-hydroxylating ferredoxin subunit